MFLLDILFPKFCLGCNRLGMYLCAECKKKLAVVEHDSCLYCGKKSYLGLTHPLCRVNDGVDGFLAGFYYSSIVKRFIKQGKYQFASEVLFELFQNTTTAVGDRLALYEKIFTKPQIQPIPLYPARLQQRGFNQALFVGDYLQKIFSFPLRQIVVRCRATRPQAQLGTRGNRHQNVKGAFAIDVEQREKLKNIPQHVMIVDDVVTSGATVREVARVLKRYGVSKVTVFALAKGSPGLL